MSTQRPAISAAKTKAIFAALFLQWQRLHGTLNITQSINQRVSCLTREVTLLKIVYLKYVIIFRKILKL